MQALLFSSGVAAAADQSEQPFGGLSFASAIAGGGGSSDGSSRHHSSASLHAQSVHAPSGPGSAHSSTASLSKSHRAPPAQVQHLMQQSNARHHEAKE